MNKLLYWFVKDWKVDTWMTFLNLVGFLCLSYLLYLFIKDCYKELNE